MNYAIWLQILMELALAVSGEQDVDDLFHKASRAFHRKLDCTHISITSTISNFSNKIIAEEVFVSPNWAQTDLGFRSMSKKLTQTCLEEDVFFLEEEENNHFNYCFQLKGYGTMVIAVGQKMSIKLIHELEPIINVFATNILACNAFAGQLKIGKELRAQKDYIEYLAYHDSLTSLPNRRKYLEMLGECLNNEESGGVLLLDLDNFKSINDTLGHSFGDKVLNYVAGELKQLTNDHIFASRFGGDEFLFLIRGKGKMEIEHLALMIIEKFNQQIRLDNHEVEIHFSMGISLFPEDSKDLNQLMMNVDLALYSVKNEKKNDYRFFDSSLMDEILYRSKVKSFIKDAIDQDGFKLVYQPQINALTGLVIGYEALIRFKKHTISPSEFIPIAEENKSIIEIGRIVTHMVIKQLSEWIEDGYQVKRVSINYSAAQINDISYIQFIENQLNHYNVDPRLIEIEITENIFIENQEATLVFLDKLKEIGIQISIDDFGKGYSSLSYLTFLPLDKIKLDRTINERFLELETIKVMDSLIMLAHSLNLKVVAEGIETKEQFKRLRIGKCDYIQGFLFSRPLEVEDVPFTFSKNYLSDDKLQGIIKG